MSLFLRSLFIFMLISLSSPSYIFAECNTFLGRTVKNCSAVYKLYRQKYSQLSAYHASFPNAIHKSKHACNHLERSAASLQSQMEESCDIPLSMAITNVTLGLACQQIKAGEAFSFKNDYCKNYMSYTPNTNARVHTQSHSSNKINPTIYEQDTSISYKAIKKIPLSEQYKDAPQLKTDKLHLYNILKISKFRNSSKKIMIESTSGNYALPIDVFKSAELINFTPKLKRMIELIQ